MAEFGNKDRSDGPRHLEPDWSYNIGEAILDIDAVTLSSFEIGILVLGEKSLHCLKDNCTSLKYAKRLEYKALCFQAYVIGIHIYIYIPHIMKLKYSKRKKERTRKNTQREETRAS